MQRQVNGMAKSPNSNKGKQASSVTPQGYADTDLAQEPKSKLEERAKKKNTK
jgi:small acid-soluble spore protein L (minor)